MIQMEAGSVRRAETSASVSSVSVPISVSESFVEPRSPTTVARRGGESKGLEEVETDYPTITRAPAANRAGVATRQTQSVKLDEVSVVGEELATDPDDADNIGSQPTMDLGMTPHLERYVASSDGKVPITSPRLPRRRRI